jgi:hypothetical protein
MLCHVEQVHVVILFLRLPNDGKFLVSAGQCGHGCLCRLGVLDAAIASPETNEYASARLDGQVSSMDANAPVDGHEVIVDEWEFPAELRAVTYGELVLAKWNQGLSILQGIAHFLTVYEELAEDGIAD